MFEYDDDNMIDHKTAMEWIDKYKPDIYCSMDWGYKPSYHSAHWYAVFYNGVVIIFDEMYGQEMIFEDFVKKMRDKSKPWHIVGTCLPHDMFRGGTDIVMNQVESLVK